MSSRCYRDDIFFIMNIDNCFYLGYITKTRGLKGEVQVYFEFDQYDELELDMVFLEFSGKVVPYFVSSAKLQANSTGYFQFEDVDHIDKAAKLLKRKVYLPLEKKPERDEDEFFYTDFKGYIASDQKIGELGEIIEVLEYPQQFIAVVSYQFRELMFPLNDDIIESFDEEEGTLLVKLPEGLVDIYTAN